MEELHREIESCQEQLKHIDAVIEAAPGDAGLIEAKANLEGCLVLLGDALRAQLEVCTPIHSV